MMDYSKYGDPNEWSSVLFSVSVTTTVTGLIAGSEKRIGLWLIPDVTTDVLIGSGPSVSNGDVGRLNHATTPWQLYLWTVGNIVRKPWFMSTAAGTAIVTVIQIMPK